MPVTNVEEAHAEGFSMYCYPNGRARTESRAKFESMGYRCIEYNEVLTSKQFTLHYLGVIKPDKPTRWERGLV